MRVGILVDRLDTDFVTALTPHVNRMVAAGTSVTLFYEEISPADPHLVCPCVHFSASWGFEGVVIATSLNTAKRLSELPANITNRIYYCWQLEWIAQNSKWYRPLKGIYSNPGLEIVVGTEGQKKVVERIWNCKVNGVVPDCDPEKIISAVDKSKIAVNLEVGT